MRRAGSLLAACAALALAGETGPPAKPPAAWLPLIGEYGAPPRLVYILEKDGKLMRYSEGAGYQALDANQLSASKDAHGIARKVSLGPEILERHVLPAANGEPFRIVPLQPVATLRAEALAATPPAEEGAFLTYDLVEVARLNPDIHLEIRYASTSNFLGVPVYTQARAFVQRPVAMALLKAAEAARKEGYGLLIHDAYRPWYVTKMFWDAVPEEDKIFVADPAKGSRHNRGCAVDLTLYDRKTGRAVEMPGGYDEMTYRSFPAYPGGSSRQRWYRDLLRTMMEKNGFTVNEAEWWHFDYKDWARYPVLNIAFENLR